MTIKRKFLGILGAVACFIEQVAAAPANRVQITPDLANGQAQAAKWIPYVQEGLTVIDVLYYGSLAVGIGIMIWCAIEWSEGGLGHLEAEIKGKRGMKQVMYAVIGLQAGIFILNTFYNL